MNQTQTTTTVALKEWSMVCEALELGKQIILLRKGGISESSGKFELEHPNFAFFPTFVHQNPSMLKSPWNQKCPSASAEPDKVTLRIAGEVTDILEVNLSQWLSPIDSLHIWTDKFIDQKYSYRPDNPLYLLLVRVYKLHKPIQIDNTIEYAGCKSWVPLKNPVDIDHATPVLGDEEFQDIRSRILDR
jgi:hypothetical protein